MGAKQKESGKILVGTASWTDPGFVERWYPKGMAAADRLAWYAGQFEMVEVNSTFYAVPDARMVERWCRSTPDGFVFDVKLHQLLSRHSTAAKLLPPKLRRGAEVDPNGKVKLTAAMEEAMIGEMLGPVKCCALSVNLARCFCRCRLLFHQRRIVWTIWRLS